MSGTNFSKGLKVFGHDVMPGSGGEVLYGDSFHVDSGHTEAADTTDAGSKSKPFLTLDYAVGRTTANNGDAIYVAPGHAETLSADSAVDIDVAGLTIIGLGSGEDRPIFTFASATAADFKLAAANTRIHNLVFKCNIASQAMMIETSADDCEISHCEFREGSATGLNFITVGVADADSDRLWIHDCKFHMPTAGNGDSAIAFAKDHTGVVIERCYVYGDFDLAGIDIPVGGNAQVDLRIQDCVITNLLTGQHAIQINGTGSTGKLVKLYVETDALATSIDAGGLEMFDCYHHVGTDQAGWTRVAVEPDSTANILGADDSNNDFASTNVAANEDGSVLERLEQIQEAVNRGAGSNVGANESLVDILYGSNGIGAFPAAAAPANSVSMSEVLRAIYDRQLGDGTDSSTNSRLGKKVTVAAADVFDGTTTALFTVATGRVLITHLEGEVVGAAVDATVSNTKFVSNPTTGTDADLCAVLDIQSDEIGTLYTITGTFSDAMLGANAGGSPGMAKPIVVPEGTIDLSSSADAGTGGATGKFELWYIPLDDGATVS